jgi:F1F0 ATPase subunit 2
MTTLSIIKPFIAMGLPVVHLDPILAVLIGAGLGLLLGGAHFLSLWWNVELYATGGCGFCALALQIGRFALLLAVMVFLAWLGALSLLSGTLGLLLARSLIVHRVRHTP